MVGDAPVDRVSQPPSRLSELPRATREFLAAMRPDELELVKYLVEHFSRDDLEVINDSLENLRTMRRFGKAALWFFGFVIMGAGAAGIVRTFFFPGGGAK